MDSARARAEKGAPRKLKRLVCGGSVVCANLLRRDATARDGWEVAANPARYAVQYGKTTRSRAAIPIHKLAQTPRLTSPLEDIPADAHARCIPPGKQ